MGRHRNLISNIVYSANSADVDTAIIDGKIVMQGRKMVTVDEKELIAAVNEASSSLVHRIFKDS